MRLLDHRVIIVSGASSGIGRAAAILFARQGARLVLNGRDRARLEQVAGLVAQAGGQALAVAGDVTAAGTHADCVARACDAFGRLDGAFNNAGTIGPVAPLADIAAGDFAGVVAANLLAAHLAVRAQVPAMLEGGGGSLVFTSSFVGNSVGLPGMGAYASAKAGLSGLVKSLAADYAHKAIRANALLPGGTDTAMAGSEDNKAWAASLHPMRRIARPEEIAQGAAFLLSDMASFVTGSALWADGGNGATKVQAPW